MKGFVGEAMIEVTTTPTTVTIDTTGLALTLAAGDTAPIQIEKLN